MPTLANTLSRTFSKSSKVDELEDELSLEDQGEAWSKQGDAGLPAYAKTEDVESGLENYVFHIYRTSQVKESTIVTSAAKDKVLYYLRVPLTNVLASSWRGVTLHEGGEAGPVVATFSKGIFRSNITLDHWPTRDPEAEGIRINLNTVSKFLCGDHEFQIPGTDKTMRWQIGKLEQKMKLIDEETKEEAAVFDWTFWAKRKLGKLTVSPKYLDQLELIVVTATILERYVYQRRLETLVVVS